MTSGQVAPELSRAFRGELIYPDHPQYDFFRAANNTRWDREPVLIARCRCTPDVVGALAEARRRELDVAVRCGGHHWAGLSTTDGVLIDLSLMRGVRADERTQTATVQGGTLAGDLQLEAGRVGLGAVTGLNEAVGMGLILNGGIGHLSPRAGWACDQILEADLVTAAGEVVTTSPDHFPELLAGVRGAAPNFGVVTSFRVQLHPVPQPVFGGSLRWAGVERIRAALGWLAEFLPTATDGLAMWGSIAITPPGREVPQDLHGQVTLRMETCHLGEPADAMAELHELQAQVAPSHSTLRQILFADLHLLPSPAKEPMWTRKSSDEEVVTDLTDDLIDRVLGHAAQLPGSARPGVQHMIEIYPFLGALARTPARRSAIATRFAGSWSILPIAFYQDAQQDGEQDRWVASVMNEVRTSGKATGLTVGNMISDASQRRMRAVFGGSHDWLRDLKRVWDPENLFKGTLNIAP